MKYGRLWFLVSLVSRVFVLCVIMLGALWPTYLNLKTAYNNARIAELSHGAAWGRFYRIMEHLDALLDSESSFPSLFNGAPPLMTLFGIPFADPVVAASVIIANPAAIAHLFAGLVAVLLVMLIAGRAYCSFGCPASLLFLCNLRVRERIERLFPRVVDFRRALPVSVRYGVLVGGVGAAALFGMWVWHVTLAHLMVSSLLVNLILGVPLGVSFSVLAFIVLADFLVMPGEFCRSVCPVGLVMGRASDRALLRIAAETVECPAGCDLCEDVCDLYLNPRLGAVPDCSLCGRCISVCPKKKLSIGVGMPLVKSKPLIAATALLALLTMPAVGLAHHYRGLPHYGYFDNYPQVPIEEYIASAGRFEINFTLYNFQGMKRSDVNQPDGLQIFLVIFDLKKKTTFGGRAVIDITSGDTITAHWDQEAEQESIFFLHTRIADPDDLTLRVSFSDPDDGRVSISSPFNMPGEGGHNPLVWVAGALVILMGIVVFASTKARPARRRRTKPEALQRNGEHDAD